MRVYGLEFRVGVWGLKFGVVFGRGVGVWGLGFEVRGSGFRVQGSGLRVYGLESRVKSLGVRFQGAGLRVCGNLGVLGGPFRAHPLLLDGPSIR